MKGLFFKKDNGTCCEILSDPMVVRNEDGYDDIFIVAKRLKDNWIDVVEVTSIGTVETDKSRLGN